MINKYSEGYPMARYYGGNMHIDEMELLCQARALEAFGLSSESWAVNVQPYSGSSANFEVYASLLDTHDRILAMDLFHGGHLSHGHRTATKNVSMVSKFWTTMTYYVRDDTGLIDYDEVALLAARFKPKILICGASAYPRFIDFARMREIADTNGAILLCDMAHIAGLVAAEVHPSPFLYSDIVTTTTHKTLRGPRGALIFFRVGQKTMGTKMEKPILYDYKNRINSTVFPGMQGGPHNHTISSIAVCLGMTRSIEFKKYQELVLSNAEAMSNEFKKLGYVLATGGTDNHLMLIDVRQIGINGSIAEKVCELVSITLNKNCLPSDTSPIYPSGIRIGSPAMTSRGCNNRDFQLIAKFVDRALRIAAKTWREAGCPKIRKFMSYLHDNEPKELLQLKKQIESFTNSLEGIK